MIFLKLMNYIFEEEEEELKYIYKNSSVYVLQYIKDELAVSSGLLNEINESELTHYCNTDHGSAGAPILSLKSFKVIGIHKGSNISRNENI